ncbi:MAG: hypothetical protein WCH83_15700 [Alphaproteobacteria bacterium]|jgi:hypothetical protein
MARVDGLSPRISSQTQHRWDRSGLAGDVYYGLWYPIVIAMMTFVIGLLFVPETKDGDIVINDTK